VPVSALMLRQGMRGHGPDLSVDPYRHLKVAVAESSGGVVQCVSQKASKAKQPLLKASKKITKGTHGGKRAEQIRLARLYKIAVSGDTHESEHTVGFEPINRTSGLKRGSGGRARRLENIAAAYQERKARHRQHIGTGSRGTADDSGFNATSYRESQRSLIESGDVSSAVQLNQLGYAFDPEFRKSRNTSEAKAAGDSFREMVGNMSHLTYAHGDQDVHIPIDATQRAEMHLSRDVAETGQYPSRMQENLVRKTYGLPELQLTEDEAK
jgi:hypothetical protein